MARYRPERLVLLISAVLLLGGCGYRFISSGGEKIFLRQVSNSTLQPRIGIFLSGELKTTFVEYPGFSPVNSEKDADLALHVNIKKWERLPLFIEKKGTDEITIARFNIETAIAVTRKGQTVMEDTVSDTLSVSLAKEYDEDGILREISRKLAAKIYFYLLDKHEKKGF